MTVDIGRDHRAALGHAIALYQIQAETEEGLRHGEGDGRTAAHGETDTPTQLLLDLAGHQFIEQGPEQQGRTRQGPFLFYLEAFPADTHCQVENGALAGRGLAELVVQAVIDPLKNARYRNDHRRFQVLDIVCQQLHRTGIGDGAATHHR